MTDRPYSAVLFDLDGTISDSAPGIIASMRWTFEQLGVPIPPHDVLMSFVGPPILDSFRGPMGLDEAMTAEALRVYREHYLAHGALDSAMFPGVGEVLHALHAAGLPISTATSKPETPATYILEHYGVVDDIDIITGASDDEVRSAKADVVAEALRRLDARGFDVSRPVLIGDRRHDVEGAAEHGVPTIFAAWGYGTPEEAVGAVAIVERPEDLLPILIPDQVAAAEPGTA